MKAIELQAFGGPLVAVDRLSLSGNSALVDSALVDSGQADSDGTVIDIAACGVCHSDIHVVDGQFGSPLPLVLGHEVTPHREYLQPLGDLDPIASAPLACGGLTAFNAARKALGTLNRRGSKARALVIGAGGLGQFGIQFLRLMSDAEVSVVDQSLEKLDRALELGANEAVTPDRLDGQFDAIIDFVGATATLESAVERVNRRGSVIAVGLYGGTVPFGVGAVPFEAQLISSVWGTVQELGDLIEFAQQHPLQYTVETLPLAQAEQAHQRLRSGHATGRIVLVP